MASAAKCGRVVTVEEHNVTRRHGLGPWPELLAERHPVPAHRMGMTGFGQSGSAAELMAYYGLDAAGIVRRVREVLGR